LNLSAVLLLEDCDAMRRLFGEIFRESDHELVVSTTVSEAWRSIACHAPEVAFIDVMLDGREQGLDFCRELQARSEQGGPYPVRVVISGRTSPQDVAAARRAGADGYLFKPFSPLQVIALMDGVAAWRMSAKGRPQHLWPYG
jgi:CheY-like chemotaxis protein